MAYMYKKKTTKPMSTLRLLLCTCVITDGKQKTGGSKLVDPKLHSNNVTYIK